MPIQHHTSEEIVSWVRLTWDPFKPNLAVKLLFQFKRFPKYGVSRGMGLSLQECTTGGFTVRECHAFGVWHQRAPKLDGDEESQHLELLYDGFLQLLVNQTHQFDVDFLAEKGQHVARVVVHDSP